MIARRTSTGPTISARPGRESSPASDPTTTSTSSARIRSAPACSTPAPSTARTSRSTTAPRWQSLSLNLPDTQISDLVVEGNDVVIATHGRSFWVLDDVSPLRQLTPETTAAAFHLFDPAEATRSAGPATIYYALKQPAKKVKIDILDPGGKVIRSFTGVREEELKPAKPGEAPGGGEGGFGPPQPRTLLTNAGLTRFSWDLRHGGHSTFPGMILWSAGNQGPTAVPGTYQVRITADGTSQTRPLNIRKHPGYAEVTQADLEQQLAFALQIRDRTSEANDAVVQIRDLKQQIQDRLTKAGNRQTELAPAAQALTAKLTAVEEDLYQVRNRSGQDPLNFPIKLNNRLASLRRVVETGDNRPTDGAHQIFKELSAELDRQLSALQSTLTNELAVLNRQLARSKIAPVTPGTKKATE